MPSIQVHLFESTEASFIEALGTHGVPFTRIPPEPGAIRASGTFIVIELSSDLLAMLVVAIGGWLTTATVQRHKTRRQRELNVTLPDGTTLNLKGYDPKVDAELLKRLLPQGARLVPLDPPSKDVSDDGDTT